MGVASGAHPASEAQRAQQGCLDCGEMVGAACLVLARPAVGPPTCCLATHLLPLSPTHPIEINRPATRLQVNSYEAHHDAEAERAKQEAQLAEAMQYAVGEEAPAGGAKAAVRNPLGAHCALAERTVHLHAGCICSRCHLNQSPAQVCLHLSAPRLASSRGKL